MIIDGVSSTLQFIVLAGAAVAVVAAFFKWFRPWWRNWRRDVVAVRDSILGRDAVVDSITRREIEPALPGIGQRMATVEQALVAFAQNQHDLDELRTSRVDHERRIVALEDASVERVVSRAESTQAFRTIEAAIKATPDAESE